MSKYTDSAEYLRKTDSYRSMRSALSYVSTGRLAMLAELGPTATQTLALQDEINRRHSKV